MALDRVRYKVEKVEEAPLSIKELIKEMADLKELLDSLPKKETDMDIKYVQEQEKNEGILSSVTQTSQDEDKNEIDNTVDIFEEFRVLLDSIKSKYGLNYLAKMSMDEEEQYIKLYSQVYNVTPDYVKKEIDYAINDMYDKKVKDISDNVVNENIDDKERIITPRNRVFEEKLAIGASNPNAMKTTSSSVYRMTRMDQINDIMNCGYVRPKEGTLSGGHKNEIFWTRGGEKLFYTGNSGVILEAAYENVKDNQIGAIPFENLIGIWEFSDEQNKYINNIDYYRKLYQEKHTDISSSVSLENLMPILQEKGYTIFGHGTGYNNIEGVQGIFNTGLRASHSSMLYTTIGLDVPNKEELQNKLDNWEHKDSENVVLIKLPNEYFNMNGESMDLDCERTGAFVNEVVKDDGSITYYLDPKFIIGSYNRNTNLVTMNPKFEKDYSPETIKEMQEKYVKTIEKTKNRIVRQLSGPIVGFSEEQTDILSNTEFSFDTTFEDFENGFEDFNGPKL